MREVLEAAETLAKEEKKIRRKRKTEHTDEITDIMSQFSSAESSVIGILAEHKLSASTKTKLELNCQLSRTDIQFEGR